MQFLNRVSLSRKLQIYLSVFLVVSLLFLVVFFAFQYNALITDEREQMLADCTAVSTRLLSNMTVQYTLLAQVVGDTHMLDFVSVEDFDSGRDHSATINALFVQYSTIESTMSGGVLRVAKDNRTMNAYPVFSMTLQEVLQKEWLDPAFLNSLNSQRVFWAVGDLDGSQCLICYKGLYKARELKMVVMMGIELSQINGILYNGSSHADMLMVSPDLDTIMGNRKLALPREKVADLLSGGPKDWAMVNGQRYMVSAMQVSSKDIGVNNWRFVVVQDLQSFSHDGMKVLLIWMAVLVSLFVLLTMLNRILTKHIVSRCNAILEHISQIASENFDVNDDLEGNDEFSIINEKLNGLSVRLKRQIVDEYNHNLELHQEQIKSQKMQLLYQKEQIAALHNQINPHYIVNTLESIRMKLLLQGDDNNAEMLLVLAESLQTYRRAPYSLVTIADEMEFIKRYLMLQNYRFIHPITYHMEVEEELYSEKIPQFVLQPLIENAIMHGFRHKIKKPHLDISFVRSGDALYIKVSDNGFGMDEQTLKMLQDRMRASEPDLHTGEDSIGLMNVYWRLKLLYGQDCDLQITSKPDYGTEVEMMLNLRKVKENELQRIDH